MATCCFGACRTVRAATAMMAGGLSLVLGHAPAYASDPDPVGATLLRQVQPALNGAGVSVAQPEGGAPTWQVNPSTVGQPAELFTYWAAGASTNVFPNALGSESWHAGAVGNAFYGSLSGLCPQVAHVDNYEAAFFYTNFIARGTAIGARVVNQSFIFSPFTLAEQRQADSAYDAFADRQKVLFVSGVGNGGAVSAPATAYNGLGVAAYGGSSSTGPTADNGRSKPDLTAPADLTSFSTPLAAGAAALLAQAAARGDGGTGTAALAADIRTVKALLLNGAIKPADWAHPAPAPLDPRYGAGILNVFNAWHQLAAGRATWIESTQVGRDAAHPAGTLSGNVPAPAGWDLNALSGSPTVDVVNHYYLAASTAGGPPSVLTATLVWNRQAGQAGLNDLDLFLLNTLDNSIVAASTSRVDNVEHLFVPRLAPGRYDLQVLKRGSARVTPAETYALAFECFAPVLALSRAGDQLVLSWPMAPAGFALVSTPALGAAAVWSPVSGAPLLTNQQNRLSFPAPSAPQFYRLRRP